MITFEQRIGPTPDLKYSSFDQRLAYRLIRAGIKNPDLLRTASDRQEQYDRLFTMTGNTPITLHENPHGTILMKRFSQNPSESHYDPVYLSTLRFLEDQGVIWPTNKNSEHGDQRVELIELTSGSAGIAFGFASMMMGFEGTLFVPEEIPDARVNPMESFGLNIIRTPKGYVRAASEQLGIHIEKLKADGYTQVRFRQNGNRALVFEKGDHRVCILNHSENKLSIEANRLAGQEIVDFFPDGTQPDALFAIIGNFTSSRGISSVMKQNYPGIEIIGLESTENPNWFVKKYPGQFEERFGKPVIFYHPTIYGSSQKGVPLHLADPTIFSHIDLFEPEEILAWQENYNRGKPWAETIGRSTAASLMMAERYTKAHPGSTVVVLNYDKADRYNLFVPADTVWTSQDDLKDQFNPRTIQPFGYKQIRPALLSQTPRTLEEAYSQSVEPIYSVNP